MYQSELHKVLRKALENTKWTRSTKDEDNFRQVVCSSLYEFISPNNVEIPSTRSGHGDIKVFGRKIELKYASNEKVETIEEVLADFDLLLEDKIEFSIVAIRLDVSSVDNYVHRAVKLPMLRKTGAAATFADHDLGPHTYCGVSIFLAATFQHAPKAITMKIGKGKNATAYLSFETATAIFRSSFLETPNGIVHVDVIGCKEDGLVIFLYKKAHHLNLKDTPNTAFSIDIPYAPAALTIATGRIVDAYSQIQKFTTLAAVQVAAPVAAPAPVGAAAAPVPVAPAAPAQSNATQLVESGARCFKI